MKIGKGAYRVMAVWMSMLIIMLPFYVSSVFAQGSDVINVLSTQGGDGIRGIRRTEGDFTKIEVEVFSSKPLTAENIQIKSTSPGTSGVPFQTCSDLSPYICTWQSSAGSLPAGAYSFYTCIGNCASCYQTSCKKTATIYADGVAPSVDMFSADRTMTNGGTVKLSYKITDKSCLAAKCAGHCSGIDKIELYDVAKDGEKTMLGAIPFNKSNECTIEGIYRFSAEGMANGERRLCMLPYDRFGQAMEVNTAGPGCIALKKDNTMPSFTAVRIMDPTESYDLMHASDSGTTAKLIVNLTSSSMFGLNESRLRADLSSVGGSPVDSIPCSSMGNGRWTCAKTFSVRGSSGSQDIRITALDVGGNNNTQTFTFSINIDGTNPVVEKITSGYEIDGVPYLKGGFNTVFAIITEQGSGLAGNKVYFGPGETNRAVCGVLGSTWVCAGNVTVQGTTFILNIHGQDDAGNRFAEAKNILVDVDNPSLLQVILTNANSNPFFVVDDDMLVTAVIRDNRAIVDDSGDYFVYLTPEGFADPNPMKAESCEQNETRGIWVCKWTIMNLAPGDVNIKFNISDFVGNNIFDRETRFDLEYLEPATGNYSILRSVDVEVYEVEGAEADYWTARAGTPMPDYVDSATTELVEHDVWIPVQLSMRSSASIFSVELAGCSGDDFGKYANNAVLVRPSPTSNKPFLRITLNKVAIDAAEMNFECALNIISKHKDMLSQIEVESFTATVPVRTHGEFSYEVAMEIMRTSQGWLVKATWIGTIGKVIDIATRICGLIGSISSAIRDIVALTGTLAAFCENNPFCFPQAPAGRAKISGLKFWESSGVWAPLYKFCGYVSCSETLWGKWMYGGKDKDGKEIEGLSQKMSEAVNEHLQGTADDKGAKSYLFGMSSDSMAGMTKEQQKELGIQQTGILSSVQAWGSPQNSLILSIGTGCIPGIFMNLQKARQIECAYLSCIVNDVPAGMPLAACTKVRNFQWCMFVFGEIFQIIPFIGSIKSLLSPIISMLKDPLTLIFGITGAACEFLPQASEHAACHFLNSVNSVIRIVNVIKQIKDAKDIFNLKGGDSCKETLQKAEEMTSKFMTQGTVGAASQAGAAQPGTAAT